MAKNPSELLYGTLDVLVLKALSPRPLHGYGISTWLRDRSNGTFDLDDAALYKALRRLEEQGAIEGEWALTENNRRARYYRLTPAGRRHLRDEQSAWRAYALTVNRILRTS